MSMGDGGKMENLKTCRLTTINGIWPIVWPSPCFVCDLELVLWKGGRKKETQRKLSLEEEDVFHVMMEHFEGGTVRVEPACKWGNY
jgi:hypothetical protein